MFSIPDFEKVITHHLQHESYKESLEVLQKQVYVRLDTPPFASSAMGFVSVNAIPQKICNDFILREC